MLAQNLGDVVVIVDHERVRGSRFAIREFGVDTIILDDGMQHLRLQRQVEVVLVDATCPFGYGRLLPAGLLREPAEGLQRASHIFITKSRDVDTEPITRQLRRINPDAEIIACYYEPVELIDLHTNEHVPLTTIRDMNVFVVSGIAQPEGFQALINELGAILQRAYSYPDHHRFRRDEIEHIYQRAKNWQVDAIVMTEKDAVRFSRRAGVQIKPCPVYMLKVAIKIKSGVEDFNDCIMRICYP
jgi:tetraacyldisaccharide 4'-kinase